MLNQPFTWVPILLPNQQAFGNCVTAPRSRQGLANFGDATGKLGAKNQTNPGHSLVHLYCSTQLQRIYVG
jgi:hypothetical protein